jgi:hypothetical protein
MQHNDELVKKLSNNICEIVFEKRDGTHRHMICTLKDDLLPYVSVNDMRESVRQNDYIPVFDLEEQAWRAFKPSKLISIEASEE